MEKGPQNNPEQKIISEDTLKGLGKMAIRTEGSKKSGETAKLAKTTCMEVYPFLFEGNNSDTNTFKEITTFLPYWKDLGIDTIWLAPVYPSPRKDMGYDISDYKEIDSRFGTLTDFDKFVTEAHRQGQKVLMDLVLNHTSTEHKWFKKALSGDPKYKNFYYFTNSPQEDWRNFFDNQSAWALSPNNTGEYYLHSFHEKQADLKWFNENGELNHVLLNEFQNILDFWTKEHHIDGFRLDVPQAIDKDFTDPERSFETVLQSNGDQSKLVIEKLFSARSELITTIEVFDITDDDSIIPRYAGPGKPIQYAMNAWISMQPEQEMLEQFSKSIGRTPFLMTTTQSHDTPRKDISNEILAKLLTYSPGAICLYVGQEIGQKNPTVEEFDNDSFFKSDAQASMQLKAALAAEKAKNGGYISQLEIDQIVANIRQSARANNRMPINSSSYLAQLKEQANMPNSTYNKLKTEIASWKSRKEQDNDQG